MNKEDRKMIEFKVSFFTNDLPQDADMWTKGCVNITSNKTKGIKSGSKLFSCKEEILRVMQELIVENDLKVVEVTETILD